MKFTSYVGIDISKSHVDVALLNGSGKLVKMFHHANTRAGFKQLHKELNALAVPSTTLFCLEHCGVYSLPMCVFFEEHSWFYSLKSGLQIKRSLGIRRGKSDKADAQAIASYAYKNQEELSCSSLPSKTLMKLKTLISYRERLLRAKVSIQTAAKEIKGFTDGALHADIVKDSEQHVEQMRRSIKEIDDQLQTLIQSDPELSQLFDLATSVKGVGLQIAVNMLVVTHGFTRFSSWRKFSCYCGLAPFEYRSGSSIRGKTRVSRLGDKRLKAIIGNGIASAIQNDPEIKQYYLRKLGEGKHKMVVLNAVKNKLISRVFAVVKRGTPFVPLYQHQAA
jgi:transposase